jgi:hypothetical protein
MAEMADEELAVPNVSEVQTPEDRIAEKMRRASEPEELKDEVQAEATEEAAEVVEVAQEPEAEDGVLAEEEPRTISSAKEAAEALGVSIEDFYSLSFPITVGEESRDMVFSEIKDSVETKERALKWQEEAKTAREEAKAYAEQSQAQIKQALAQANQLTEGLDAMYLAPYQQVDWATLREEDPAEFAAKRQEYLDTKNAVDAKKAEVAQQIEAYKTQANDDQMASQREVLAREQAALHKAWPEMADDTVDSETGKTKGDLVRAGLVNELKGRGFTDDEIGQAADSRMILLARDAMLYRAQSERANVATKKVVKIGKTVLTPGAAQSKAEGLRAAVDPLRQKLRKSGKVEDFAALLSHKIRR